jgi:hypothetical protein
MDIFDINKAKSIAKGYDLKVTLKKNFKGTSLFAKKPIKKGSIIAYYKFLVHKNNDDNFNGVNNNMYAIAVYGKNGKEKDNLIGDIFKGSLEPPKHNIPFWAYFSNEPSKGQEENAEIDTNLKINYKNRNRVKPNDTMVYKLISTKNIKPGEEITWCYGGEYKRNYESNC